MRMYLFLLSVFQSSYAIDAVFYVDCKLLYPFSRLTENMVTLRFGYHNSAGENGEFRNERCANRN